MNFQKKDCIAMLLAGGQGSRLLVLTENTAKPAVPFGGKYRIIDFPLSNCVNSGIDTVGILTQYQPLELNEYIGNGKPWGLSSNSGGIHVLSPYSKSKSSEWYSGTANAIYQNINFIERYKPDNVLILSGDHIYKMDYSKMMHFHKKIDADCTIAVLDVPLKEASRFGIMNTNADGSVYEFEEKPKAPKSTKASMGIYIFKWDMLKKYLIEDSENKSSDHDFGKNIIPAMLNEGHRLYAYEFSGYGKDVGTIESLWEANMDILGENPKLDLKSSEGKIYARNFAMPSSYIAPGSKIVNSYVAEGSEIYGEVYNSIISSGCTIENGAKIYNSFIMPNTRIEKNAVVKYAIVGEDTVIHANAKVGDDPEFYSKSEWGISVVGKNKELAQNFILAPKSTY